MGVEPYVAEMTWTKNGDWWGVWHRKRVAGAGASSDGMRFRG